MKIRGVSTLVNDDPSLLLFLPSFYLFKTNGKYKINKIIIHERCYEDVDDYFWLMLF